MLLWQFFYEIPMSKKKAEQQTKVLNKEEVQEMQVEKVSSVENVEKKDFFIPKNLVISSSKANRVEFENSKIKGSINAIGLRVDNLVLKNYKSDNNPLSLLNPAETRDVYFVQFGFAQKNDVEESKKITLPNNNTVWNITKDKSKNIILASWKSPENVTFEVMFVLDENYMFDIFQSAKNDTGKKIDISTFVKIFKSLPIKEEDTVISHEGFLGFYQNRFYEIKYNKIVKTKRFTMPSESETFWAGFTDKYWFTAFIYNNEVCTNGKCAVVPADLSLNYIKEGGVSKFQADFLTDSVEVASGERAVFPSKLFSGAKELKMIDKYQKEGFNYNNTKREIPHFDKSIDFGIFYFLTKPIFLLIIFLNSFIHNFGFSIIVLTIIVKLILAPIANKSYVSMAKMKAVAPLVEKIRKETAENKIEQNRKIMEVYREKQVNPLSGCLPLILQIPVFFALYKVLFISIEMNGAPFILWIKDLSLKDPTSIFNLFGLLPFTVPSFLQIGVLPILMGLTTYIQQSLSPKSADSMQATFIKIMPFLLVFVFASFPSGIVLYWVTNNIVSILQQLYAEKFLVSKLSKKDGGLATKNGK